MADLSLTPSIDTSIHWSDALQAYAGLVASLLSAAVTAQVKGRLADQLQAALEHRWLIEQA